MILSRYLAKRRHRRMETTGPRLARLTDDPWSEFAGRRAWCDGVKRRCFCGDRCCACRHTERPPGREATP